MQDAEKLSMGIIGLGGITKQAFEELGGVYTIDGEERPLREALKRIIFYDHGSASFESNYNLHKGSLRRKVPDYEYYFDVQTSDNFSRFMQQSDIILLNAGRYTPSTFLGQDKQGKPKIVEHFDDLEGMLEHEAEKTSIQSTDFVTAYYVLKALRACQDEGFFENPFRTQVMLPLSLPVVMSYAHEFRKFFDEYPEEAERKFLAVNSNSSENNLDAVLSVVPEFRERAVSLAIDKKRLFELVNDRPDIPRPPMSLVHAGVVGDHDAYIIPNFSRLLLELVGTEHENRIEQFKQWFSTHYNTLMGTFRDELVKYYVERKAGERSILDRQAGEGIIDIIRTILSGSINTGGYFRKLPQLGNGKGLSFVDEYTVKRRGGKFTLIPQPQELDELTREAVRECERAHIAFHARLVKSPYIPVHGFPGNESSAGTVEVVQNYRELPRKHTELVVATGSIEEGKPVSGITGVDVSDPEIRRVLTFDDPTLRVVGTFLIGEKERIVCGFNEQYVVVDPDTFEIEYTRKISSRKIRKVPEGKNPKRMRINSFAYMDSTLFFSHPLYGVVGVNLLKREEGSFTIPSNNVKEAIRGVAINSEDQHVYYIDGPFVNVHDVQGKHVGTHTAPIGTSNLEALTFHEDMVYASSGSDEKKHGHIFASRQGEFGELQRVTLKDGDGLYKILRGIVFMKPFVEDERNYLFCAHSNIGSVLEVTDEHAAQLVQSFRTDGDIVGIEKGVHYYAIDSAEGKPNDKVYERDRRTGKESVLLDISQKRGDYALHTLNLVTTTRGKP